MIYEKIGEDENYIKYRTNPKPLKIIIGLLFFSIAGIMCYFVALALLGHFVDFDTGIQEKFFFAGQITGLAVMGGLFLSAFIFLALLFREQLKKGMLQRMLRANWQKKQCIFKHGFSNESRFWYYLLWQFPSEAWVPKPDSHQEQPVNK